jgi:hypothetical protein
MDKLLLEVFVFIMEKLLFISIDLPIESTLIWDDTIILNMQCLNGLEIVDLNIVTLWVELQQVSLIIP